MAPNIPKYISSDTVFAAVRARFRKNDIGSIGCAVRASQTTKPMRSTAPTPHKKPRGAPGPRHKGADDLRTVPAEVVAVDDSPDEGEQTAADEAETGHVEAAVRAERLGQAEGCERDHDEADGHVQPEDPVPVESLGDGASDERADGD